MSKKLTSVIRKLVVCGLVVHSNLTFAQTIDTSGRDGSDGRDGTSHSTSPGASFRHGQDGGDATRSTPGEDARDIRVRIQDKGDQRSGQLVVIGEAGNRDNNQESRLTPSTSLFLRARGGKGGDGGDGGNGQGGCNGSSGRDASRYSRGTDGGNGCDGGDGGDATPGSDGGDGGNVLVTLQEEDIHLTPFVSWDVSAGDGGRASRNGTGGSGGHGGRGGSSYSWTESHSRTVSKTCSQSNGDGSYRTYTCYETETYYTHHSNPGGSSGWNGSSGSSGRGNTSSGSRGNEGTASFVVEYKDGRKEKYSRPFRLTLKSYRIRDENNDGVYEPGEKLIVDQIVVANEAEMPTPGEKGQVIVTLNSSSWLLAEPQSLLIPQILGRSQYQVPGQLIYQIRNNRLPISDKVASAQDTVVPMASIRKIYAGLKTFDLPRTIAVSYPISLSVDIGKSRLGVGESTPIVWRIQNLSNQAISIPGSSRNIELGFSYAGGDADKGSFLFSPNQELADPGNKSEHWLFKVGGIEPRGSVVLKGEIKISESAQPYTRFNLNSSLYLSDYLETKNMEKIEQDQTSVQIGQIFKFNPESEFLFVTNRSTSKNQVDTLKSIMKSWGLKIDLWDFTYYENFQIHKTLEEFGKTLTQLYSGKTIVFLTDSMKNSSESVRMLNQISQKDFELSATAEGINFMAFGSNPELLNSFLTRIVRPPANGGVAEKIFKNESEFATEIGQGQIQDLHGMGFSESIKADDLRTVIEKRAREIIRNINRKMPGTNYFVTYQSMGGKNNEIQFVLHRGLSYKAGRATIIVDTPSNLDSATFYNSQEFFRKFAVGLGFPQKLRFLLMDRSEWSATQNQTLIDTIVAELIEEADLRKGKTTNRKDSSDQLFTEMLVNTLKTNKSRSMNGLIDEIEQIFTKFDFYLTEKFGSTSDFSNIIRSQFDLRKDSVEKLKASLQMELDRRNKILIGNSSEDNVRRMLTWHSYYKTNRTLSTIQKLQDSAYQVNWSTRRREGF